MRGTSVGLKPSQFTPTFLIFNNPSLILIKIFNSETVHQVAAEAFFMFINQAFLSFLLCYLSIASECKFVQLFNISS